MAQGITQWPGIRYRMVWRQLCDDHVEHAGLTSSMKSDARGIIHHLCISIQCPLGMPALLHMDHVHSSYACRCMLTVQARGWALTTKENTRPRANASLFVPFMTPMAVVKAMTCKTAMCKCSSWVRQLSLLLICSMTFCTRGSALDGHGGTGLTQAVWDDGMPPEPTTRV